MKRLIIFLIRRRLDLHKYECFRFINQKTTDVYYFSEDKLVKLINGQSYPVLSGVSLNWLLNDKCKITTTI